MSQSTGPPLLSVNASPVVLGQTFLVIFLVLRVKALKALVKVFVGQVASMVAYRQAVKTCYITAL